jgi:hypothetical protein
MDSSFRIGPQDPQILRRFGFVRAGVSQSLRPSSNRDNVRAEHSSLQSAQ